MFSNFLKQTKKKLSLNDLCSYGKSALQIAVLQLQINCKLIVNIKIIVNWIFQCLGQFSELSYISKISFVRGIFE